MTDLATDPVSLATLITAVATLITVVVLVWQTIVSKKTAHGDFTLRLNDDFFYEPNNKKIIRLINGNETILALNGGEIVDADLDDYLGIFELLQIYLKDGTITKKTTYAMFGFYIKKTWEYEEIRNYIDDVRTAESDDTYFDGLEYLYNRFNKTKECKLSKYLGLESKRKEDL